MTSRVRVANHSAAECDVAGAAVDRIVGIDQALFDGSRSGHDLERRTRLIRILNRAVAARQDIRGIEVVRVEGGIARHPEDFPGVHVGDDAHTAPFGMNSAAAL